MPCVSSGSVTREQVHTRLLPMPRTRSSRGAPLCGSEPASRATSAATGSSAGKIRCVSSAGEVAPSAAAPLAFAHTTRLASEAHSQAGIALSANGESRASRVSARIVSAGSDAIIRVRRAKRQRKQTLNTALAPRPRGAARNALSCANNLNVGRADARRFHIAITVGKLTGQAGLEGVARSMRRTPMANDPTWNFDVPTQMRQFAEQSVEQAKKAVDGFLTAAQKTASTLETQANTAQSGAKDVREKVMGFAEENINNSFAFAQRLVRAKDIQEVMALQQEFLKQQMQQMQDQAKDLGASAVQAAKPKG